MVVGALTRTTAHLGLELLVAAGIIRTVAVTPTFASVGVLAVIMLIRTLLRFSLELEITGRWPRQGLFGQFQPEAAGAGHDTGRDVDIQQ